MENSLINSRVISSLPRFPHCFVCGADNPRGLHTNFSINKNTAKATFVADETHLGYENAVHGGIISSLLDEAVIWACYASTGRFGVTAELSIRFKKPLPIHKKCIVEGKMVEDKSKVWIAEAKLRDEVNTYAKATAKIVPYK